MCLTFSSFHIKSSGWTLSNQRSFTIFIIHWHQLVQLTYFLHLHLLGWHPFFLSLFFFVAALIALVHVTKISHMDKAIQLWLIKIYSRQWKNSLRHMCASSSSCLTYIYIYFEVANGQLQSGSSIVTHVLFIFIFDLFDLLPTCIHTIAAESTIYFRLLVLPSSSSLLLLVFVLPLRTSKIINDLLRSFSLMFS